MLEFIQNHPFETAVIVLLSGIFLFLFIIIARSGKQLKAQQAHFTEANVLLNQYGQKQDNIASQQHSEFTRIGEQQYKVSENLIEKLGANQNKLTESFGKFENSVQSGFNIFNEQLSGKVGQATEKQQKELFQFKEQLQQTIQVLKEQIAHNQKESQEVMHTQFRRGIKDVREELTISLKTQAESFDKNMSGLTQTTDERLKEISGQVEKRLADGFEKTTQTFQDVLKRLALIDDAQKKITELSSNVVSLQEILADKRSRGAFGEVQLESLVRNVMPANSYKFQYAFSNKKMVDCALFLPEPTGTIGVDAKFPLENFQRMMDHDSSEIERRQAQSQFVKDVKKHVNDIASKYIIERETAPGAVMFIPAEAIFAEIHAHHPAIVEYAQQSKVWMVSPTTMMALLTTASAVLKDEATRKQVHIIQEHLAMLSKDFGRFKTRMTNLSRHIDNVTKDVKDITTSADKISSRFEKIEQVQLPDEEAEPKLEVETVKQLEGKNAQ